MRDANSRRLAADGAPVLEARGVSKRFGGVVALRNVDFSLAAGEIHALMGENGAGKSTLMKILSGVYTDFDGELALDGAPARFQSVSSSCASRLIRARIGSSATIVSPGSIAMRPRGRIWSGREDLVPRNLPHPRRFGCLLSDHECRRSTDVPGGIKGVEVVRDGGLERFDDLGCGHGWR